MLVFVPLSPAEVARWASGTPYAGVAYAATITMLAAFGLEMADEEDTERTLLHVAGLDALRRYGVRTVAVASAPTMADDETDMGTVTVGPLPWTTVSALFADAPDAAASVRRTAAALTSGDGPPPLAEAWDHPAHEALLAEADLLWFGPEEWARLA